MPVLTVGSMANLQLKSYFLEDMNKKSMSWHTFFSRAVSEEAVVPFTGKGLFAHLVNSETKNLGVSKKSRSRNRLMKKICPKIVKNRVGL
jgi:hypothetical protein